MILPYFFYGFFLLQLTLSSSGVDYPTHQLVLRSLDKKCVNSAKSSVSVSEAGNIVKQPEVSRDL